MSPSAQPAPAEQAGFHPGHSPWTVALTVTLATFMEVLDTSIANVALPHIAGGLSATPDESTWTLTSYLVSNAVVLPISGWLATRVGRKRFYMTCVALFTVSSFLCGVAPTLGWLIFFRVLQGAGGGGLAPSEQSILADTFEPSRRGMAFSVYGMAVVLAPAIGPTLGGYITDHVSWRWIFFLNVPVGMVSLLLTSRVVQDPPWLTTAEKRRVPIDFVGLSLIATGLAALQVVLDKGQEDDWFASSFISGFACYAAVALIVFVVWELRQPQPIVDLRMFRVRAFAASNLLIFVLGAVLFSTTVLLPQFLQLFMGYTAQQAGLVLSPGAAAIILCLPLVGVLVSRVQARWLIVIGFVITSFAMWNMTNLSLEISMRTAVIWRIYQAAGLAFLFIPINTVAYVGVPREKNNEVSGMMNLSRNLGG
ncbi:MAG TPA: DHA2 family efflux MFS transporter permease subunit, partial [Polyangiaceae bacterium]